MRDSTGILRSRVRPSPVHWASACGVRLRPYQVAPALAIADSILKGRGLTFVVVMPRQSGKNEVQRHLLAWLMFRAAERGGDIVSVSPTFKPQTVNAMDRLRRSLDRNPATHRLWKAERGFVFRLLNARVQFFSGEPEAKVVGATADLLLSVDEAQDISPAKFDKDFDPMTASTNATRVFWGTAWTSRTLLARQVQIAKLEQEQDGIQRLFFYTAEDVRALVPPYGAHVDRVVAQRGREHPLVKTQYFCEDIDAQAGMFHATRRALMGCAPSQPPPFSSKMGEVPRRGGGGIHAFCIDVAGQDEAALNGGRVGTEGAVSRPLMSVSSEPRDATTLSIIEIDLSTLPTLLAPTYRVVRRQAWTGRSHVDIFGQLKALAETWGPRHIVIDATGVGEGLWALLDRAFPTRVMPVKFTQHSKSELGYGFLAIIDSGRFRDCAPSAEVDLQYESCMSEILPGPQHTLRWGVPEGTRGPTGELIHDDYVTADALAAELDRLRWSVSTAPMVVPPKEDRP